MEGPTGTTPASAAKPPEAPTSTATVPASSPEQPTPAPVATTPIQHTPATTTTTTTTSNTAPHTVATSATPQQQVGDDGGAVAVANSGDAAPDSSIPSNGASPLALSPYPPGPGPPIAVAQTTSHGGPHVAPSQTPSHDPSAAAPTQQRHAPPPQTTTTTTLLSPMRSVQQQQQPQQPQLLMHSAHGTAQHMQPPPQPPPPYYYPAYASHPSGPYSSPGVVLGSPYALQQQPQAPPPPHSAGGAAAPVSQPPPQQQQVQVVQQQQPQQMQMSQVHQQQMQMQQQQQVPAQQQQQQQQIQVHSTPPAGGTPMTAVLASPTLTQPSPSQPPLSNASTPLQYHQPQQHPHPQYQPQQVQQQQQQQQQPQQVQQHALHPQQVQQQPPPPYPQQQQPIWHGHPHAYPPPHGAYMYHPPPQPQHHPSQPQPPQQQAVMYHPHPPQASPEAWKPAGTTPLPMTAPGVPNSANSTVGTTTIASPAAAPSSHPTASPNAATASAPVLSYGWAAPTQYAPYGWAPVGPPGTPQQAAQVQQQQMSQQRQQQSQQQQQQQPPTQQPHHVQQMTPYEQVLQDQHSRQELRQQKFQQQQQRIFQQRSIAQAHHVMATANMASNNASNKHPSLPLMLLKSGKIDGRPGATSPTEIATSHRDDVEHMGCTCKKTRCLKLYCQCFGIKLYCGPNCRCLQCFNNVEHETERQHAMRVISIRNPAAFCTKFKKDGVGGRPGSAGALTQSRTDEETARSGTVEADSALPGSETKVLTHRVGCKCRKSACMKKYCECYAGNVKCSASCRCFGCKNMGGPSVIGYPGDGGVGSSMQASANAMNPYHGGHPHVAYPPPPHPSHAYMPPPHMLPPPLPPPHMRQPQQPQPTSSEPWVAAQSLTFLKRGSPASDKKRAMPYALGVSPITKSPAMGVGGEIGSMPSLASSASDSSPSAGDRLGTKPRPAMSTPQTDRAKANGDNALLMAAMAMTEFGQSPPPSESQHAATTKMSPMVRTSLDRTKSSSKRTIDFGKDDEEVDTPDKKTSAKTTSSTGRAKSRRKTMGYNEDGTIIKK